MSHFKKMIRGRINRAISSQPVHLVGSDRRRMRRINLWVETVESRQLLTLPAVLTIPMMPDLDQFGDQILVVQAFGVPERTALGIFDSGASAVTFAGQDQDFFGMGDVGAIPIKVVGGASAEGIGGAITGDVSEPGTIFSDGMHSFNLSFDDMGFPQFNIALSESAISTPDIQAFVGTDDSPLLPTITGTPALNASPKYPDGAAAHIRMQGATLDFSDIFPDLLIPFPDLNFAAPGETITYNPADTTIFDTVNLPLIPFGGDNSDDPGDLITESNLWLIPNVTSTVGDVTSSNGNFLFDTGAQLSVISTEMASSLGLDLGNPTTTIDVQGVAGNETVPGFTLKSLNIQRADGGILQFTDVPVYVLDVAPGIDGIFGMNLMNVANEFVFDPHSPNGPQLSIAYFANPDRGAPPEDPGLGDLAALFKLVGLNALGGALGGAHALPKFEVPKINSTTSLTTPATPVEFGANWSIDTTIGFPSGSPTPTGNVDLKNNGVVFASPAVNAQGKASWSSPATPWEPGTYQITASYTGDSKYNSSVSTTQSVTIAKATTVLTLQGTGVDFGQSLTITGKLSAGTGVSVLNSPIQLKVDGTVVSHTTVSADGSYSFVVNNLSAGSHSFQTTFAETTHFKPTSSVLTSLTVSKASSTLSLNGTGVDFGQSLILTGKMIPSTGASVLNSPIQLKVDGIVTANTTASADGSYSFSVNNLGAGSHSFQAMFNESANFKTASSTPASIAIAKAGTSLTLQGTAITFGQSLTLTGKMTSSTGASVLNSPIQLKVDGIVTANTTASADGSYSFSVNNLGAGSHSFQTLFNESANFKSVSSTLTTVAVAKAETGLTLAASGTQINAGQSVSLSGKLTSNPSGSVLNFPIQFKIDGVIISNNSTTSSADGSYAFTLNNLGVGSHMIQAVYGESADFKGSSSTTLNIAVTKVAGSLSVTAPSKAVFGQIVAVTAQVLPSQASAYEGAVVTFYDDKKVLGTSKMQAGKAVWNFNSTTVNQMLHFNAKVAETSTGSSAASPMAMMSVGKASTSVSWTIVKKPGNNQEWTIKISPTAPGAGTPTGQIKITLGGTRPKTTNLNLVAGKVVYKFKAPAGTPKSIAFVGDTNFSASMKNV